MDRSTLIQCDCAVSGERVAAVPQSWLAAGQVSGRIAAVSKGEPMATGKGGRRRWLLIGTLLLAALPGAGAAQAQAPDSSTVQRMNAIKSQIKGLQDELRAMRRDLAARDNQLRAAQRDAVQAREEARRTRATPALTAAGQPPAGAPRLVQGQPRAAGQQGGAPDLSAPAGTESGQGARGQLDTGQQNASTTPGPTPMGIFRIGPAT